MQARYISLINENIWNMNLEHYEFSDTVKKDLDVKYTTPQELYYSKDKLKLSL